MTMWEYYKDRIKHKDPLDAFYKDPVRIAVEKWNRRVGEDE